MQTKNLYILIQDNGDGFSPKTLKVPVECTYESLGISPYAVITINGED